MVGIVLLLVRKRILNLDKKLELLSPAGDIVRLKAAVDYGADAVYLAGEEFGMRTAASNFGEEDLRKGVEYAHTRGAKVFVACNTLPHNEEIPRIPEFLEMVADTGADALIASDIGTMGLIKKYAPKLELHISVQSGIVNYETARAFYNMGAKRIVTARELSLNEIAEIRAKTPNELEIEAFVHGAMCVSYSGRCLLSNYLTNRDSNRGECAQPCRWKYYLMEEKRPNQYMPVFENENGTFIFNSKDLCMIRHIPELVKSGVKSFKIEGRVKSEYYVATVVKAYREAIDRYYEQGENYKFDENWFEELGKVSHREYSEGFYFGNPEEIYSYGSYVRDYDIVGMVQDYDPETQIVTIEQRNRFYKGDIIEFLPPEGKFYSQCVEYMENAEGIEINVAPHPQMILKMKVLQPMIKDTIVRKAVGGTENGQSI